MSDTLSSTPSAAPATPAAPAAPASAGGAPAVATPKTNPLRQPGANASAFTPEPAIASASAEAAASAEPEIIAEPTPASPTFKVKVKGKLKEVSLEDLQRGYIAQDTFTQNQQRLAEERRVFQAQQAQEQQRQQQFATQLQQTQAFLRDPKQVYSYLTQLAQQTGWTPDGPDAMAQPVTAGQVHMTLQQRQALMEKQFNERLNSAVSNVERQFRAREIAANKSVFEKFLDGYVRENAHLEEVVDVDEFKRLVKEEAGVSVRFAAESGQPVEDWADYSLQQLKAAAERRVGRFAPYFENKKKLAAASTPAAARFDTQPSGGKPVAAQPRGPFKPGTPEIKAALKDFLKQQGWTNDPAA